MPVKSAAGPLELSAERWFQFPVDRVWALCVSKEGLESWWSPEDLRTTVKRIEPHLGGKLVLSLRYVPAMVGKKHAETFQAAGVPISFTLQGNFSEFERERSLTLAMTLILDRAGAGIETQTRLRFEPVAGGTRVRLEVQGKEEPHMMTLGKANLEGQLERLGLALSSSASASG